MKEMCLIAYGLELNISEEEEAMESREEDEAFIEMPTDEDFEKTRFQIFHQTKQYELS